MPATRHLAIESLERRRLLAFNPTAIEQEFLQLTNRFRSDPQGEFSRLISSASPIVARDPTLQNDLNAFSVNGNVLRSELQSLSSVPPLGWNEAIYEFAKSHNAKMIGSNPPQHFHSNNVQRREALLAAGVQLRIVLGERINSENVFGYAKSVTHLHASYVIDWGSGTGGMQPGRPHRTSLMDPNFEQIGHAISSYSGSNFGPLVNTQVLANIENPPVMVVGAIFEDKNDSNWYEAGEGIGNVQFVFEGSAGSFTTTSMTAGGYQISLPAGTYRATASGGGMRYPVVVPSVTVGGKNIWQNFIFDPDVIPPDRLEANNTLATATPLNGGTQTLAGLSIHVASDTDYFRLESLGTGAANMELRFTHAEGNLDLRLLNRTGGLIGSSTTAGNVESISANLVRGEVYYVQVLSSGGAKNGSYTLTVTPPKPAPPIASNDCAHANNPARSATIDVLANDSDPDGDAATLTPKLIAGTHPAFQLNGKQVVYTAPAGYAGMHRAKYTVTDDQGLTSAQAQIEVFVVNFDVARPWRNAARSSDVNDDGVTAPSDALLIVNDLNSRSARQLPTGYAGAGGILGFYDCNGDGFVSPIDVLIIVNILNAASGEGEPVATAPAPLASDEALLQLMTADHESLERLRDEVVGNFGDYQLSAALSARVAQ